MQAIELIEIYLKPSMVLLEPVVERIATGQMEKKPYSDPDWPVPEGQEHPMQLGRCRFDRARRVLSGTMNGFVGTSR